MSGSRSLISLAGGLVLNLTPKRNFYLYRFCRRYVDRFDGQNNCDIDMNGESRLMREILPQCKVVFDVGANIGDWAALAHNINPSIELHCFEPCRATYEKLHARLASLPIKCNNVGLSAEVKEAILFSSKESALNSLYARDHIQEIKDRRQEVIKLIALDDYCAAASLPTIDFLKLDVEGHELMALKGAHRLLSQGKIRAIQFEYGGTFIDARVLLKDIFDQFKNYPYTFYKLYPTKILKLSSYTHELENFQYQNFVILHNEYKLP
jgi:FkbM family methyltransferase